MCNGLLFARRKEPYDPCLLYTSADLLSQAEHDRLASPVLVTDSADLAKAVQAELEVQIPQLPRAAIARASVDDNGKIILCTDLHKAIEACNIIAPEHLEVCVEDPFGEMCIRDSCSCVHDSTQTAPCQAKSAKFFTLPQNC